MRKIGVVLGLALALPMAALADPPPIDAYAGLQISSPRLSPDGDTIAMIGVYEGRQALVVRNLDTGHATVVPTGPTFPDWFQWKSSNRLMASVRFTADLGHINAVAETRLVFMDVDGTHGALVKLSHDLPIGTHVFGNVGNRVPNVQDRVVSLLPNDPDHVLMAVTPENDYVHPDLVRVDVNNGRASIAQRGTNEITDYFTNADGVALAGLRIGRENWGAKETEITVLARESEHAEWSTINVAEFNHQRGHRMLVQGFNSATPGQLYVLTEGEGEKLAARAYDLSAHSLGPVIAGNPRCDVIALHQDYQVIGFTLPCEDHRTIYLDAAWQHDWDILTKSLKARLVTIVDRSVAGKRTLAVVKESPTAPAASWLIDRRGDKTEVRWIGEAYDKVPRDQVAEMKRVNYTARDGLTIPAFLTMPVGVEKGPIPFVVLPHGGPSAHDEIHFDWMVQFLASRGYGVLQPQFRGSTGYGAAFEEAGLAQWGLAMQDDVTDGTKWLIERKLAEPGRICIVGGSYGGYAALMGVVKEPTLYACAAAFAPVSDIDDFLHRIRQFAFKDINLPRVVNDKSDTDAISPSENAAKIRVPVLLMHGNKDFTVPVEQSQVMERALKRAGKQVEAIYLDGADHYFSQGSDRVAWLTALEMLLGSTIGKAGPAAAGPASQ